MPKAMRSDATPAERKLSKRGAETEKRFLDAANEVFWAHGFAGAKIAQIITAGDLSVGSFYHLFADKSELLDRAAERLSEDFHNSFDALDLSRAANGDVFTMFYRMSYAGRLLVGRHRGIYRATAELAQNDVSGFGPMQSFAPTIVRGVQAVMPDYADQLSKRTSADDVAHAVQLITMSGLQTELGMGPLYPKDIGAFARVIARAACGILGYTGQTAEPATQIGGGDTP